MGMEECCPEIVSQNKRANTDCSYSRPAKLLKIEQECDDVEFNCFDTNEEVVVVPLEAYQKAILLLEKALNSVDDVKRLLKEGESMARQLSEKNMKPRKKQHALKKKIRNLKRKLEKEKTEQNIQKKR